jgi:hypothetical protein
MMKINIAILILTAFVFASCKTSTSPSTTTTGGSGVPSTANTMIITVGGTTDTIYVTGIDSTVSGVKTIIVGGVNAAGIGVTIDLVNITAAGTYNIGPVTGSITSPGWVVMTYSISSKSGNATTYTSPQQPGVGTSSVGSISITTLSSSSLEATFYGTLTLQNGSTTVTITSGGVNATFI